jgi:signal transduction histidine kinase
VRTTIRRARAWTRSYPTATDGLLAAVLLTLGYVSSRASVELTEAAAIPGVDVPTRAEEVAGLVVTIAPLALRRRAPIAALLVAAAGFVGSRILLDAAEASIVGIALSISIYSAAAYGRAPHRHWACGVAAAAVIGELWRELTLDIPGVEADTDLVKVFAMVFYAALIVAMWALGSAMGSGRRRAAELLDRTLQLERQREENARRAVFDERVRIARELHDVVAHHVSVMGVQAGAARLVMERDPESATASLASIERASRQAVEELHRLLGFLRQAGDPDDLGARPGVGQLRTLAADMSGPDLTVEVGIEGEERSLPPTVDVSAYRIVQEALTNTLKHAGATHAGVRIRYWPGEIEVEVVDDGRARPAATNGSRPGGLGLVGMRERAALHGGRLEAGPRRGGGFAVRAKLPTPEGAL